MGEMLGIKQSGVDDKENLDDFESEELESRVENTVEWIANI